MQVWFQSFLQVAVKLYHYPVLRWALWTLLGLVLFDQLAVFLVEKFQILPRKPVLFPHQEVPAAQRSTLREVLFAANTLRDDLTPILLPEHSDDAHLPYYNAIMANLETREDISWLVLEETGVAGVLRNLRDSRQRRVDGAGSGYSGMYNEAGVPLTAAEEHLYSHYNLIERAHALGAYFEKERAEKKLDTWEHDYVNTFVPAFKSLWPESAGLTLSMDEKQAADATLQYEKLMRDRNRAIAYLKLHPPTPMGWAPLTPDAWEKTRRSDIDTGNLHGRAEWKPMYRTWPLENVPFMWSDPELSEQEREAASEQLLTFLKNDETRRDRIRKFLAELKAQETP